MRFFDNAITFCVVLALVNLFYCKGLIFHLLSGRILANFQRVGAWVKRISTKDVIANTVFELLQTSCIEDVSVADIVIESEISKRTFYNYFHDKYDVCNYIYDRLAEDCLINGNRKSTFAEFMLKISAHSDGDYFKFFLNTAFYQGQDCLMDHIIEKLTSIFHQFLIDLGKPELYTPENIERYVIYARGIISTMQYYYRKKIPMADVSFEHNVYEALPKNLYDILVAE